MIEFNCVNCRHSFRVAAEHAGKRGRCKSCGNLMKIPMPDPPLVAVPPIPAAPTPPPIPIVADSESDMSKLYWLGGIGSGLMFLGPFCPVMFAPMIGEVSFVINGRVDGVLVVLMSFISAFMVLRKNFRWLCVPGLIALSVLTFFVLNFWHKTSEMQRELREELRGNPFGGLAEAVAKQMRLEYGVAVMGLGIALVLLASHFAWQSHKALKSRIHP